MDPLLSVVLWSLPPLALVGAYWPVARSRWSALMRNALAIGLTAALVVWLGVAVVAMLRLGPWSAHPQPRWTVLVPACALAGALFAGPLGWAIGVIYQHWRAFLRGKLTTDTYAAIQVLAAIMVLLILLFVYLSGMAYLLELAKRNRTSEASSAPTPAASHPSSPAPTP